MLTSRWTWLLFFLNFSWSFHLKILRFSHDLVYEKLDKIEDITAGEYSDLLSSSIQLLGSNDGTMGLSIPDLLKISTSRSAYVSRNVNEVILAAFLHGEELGVSVCKKVFQELINSEDNLGALNALLKSLIFTLADFESNRKAKLHPVTLMFEVASKECAAWKDRHLSSGHVSMDLSKEILSLGILAITGLLPCENGQQINGDSSLIIKKCSTLKSKAILRSTDVVRFVEALLMLESEYLDRVFSIPKLTEPSDSFSWSPSKAVFASTISTSTLSIGTMDYTHLQGYTLDQWLLTLLTTYGNFLASDRRTSRGLKTVAPLQCFTRLVLLSQSPPFSNICADTIAAAITLRSMSRSTHAFLQCKQYYETARKLNGA